ncbi:MAG TPA: glycoside hydrolase family 38 C-terminal domain-containing protein [Gaiellaceae bacterium]|nr:glycoside hydrolase family 38 C-terminal domain-containing protein [Gaiellaceae bacterium]
MIQHLEYTRRRFVRTSERLQAAVWTDVRPVDELLVAGPVDRIPYEAAQALEYRAAELGERFGPLWATYWFRVRATVPEAWRAERVELRWHSDSEATLWRDGRVVAGLNRHHAEATLADAAEPGELAVEVELACNGLFGRQDRPVELTRCELARFDAAAWKLAHDFELLRALEAHPATDPALAGRLRAGLERYCDTRDAAHLDELYELHNPEHVHEIVATGHAHIDTAWLWPLEETYRKTLRTFSTAVRYMDEYPEYRFACSQAQQYAWVKERNPDLYERIRAKVEAGQFVPVGGSWVEPDLNLPSGESLVRQLLHGQRFFEREFGRRCGEFWAPDAFGYTGQLPQLMRGAGITRFLTQKLSWNRFNRPDDHTFVWQGDDGSEVLVHFPPADNYSSMADANELVKTAHEYKNLDRSHTSILLFGHGDGGGGPTREMLESLRRARDLQGLPRTRVDAPGAFFDALEAEDGERPVVVGELYFEYHRGVYTTQAFVKQGNRRGERGLHDAELLAVARGGAYPRAELDRLWKLLLLQQFHDILPGSSITLVYDDCRRDFAELERGIAALVGDGAALVNTTQFTRREVVDGALREAEPFAAARPAAPDDEVRRDGLTLENAHLRVTLSEDGLVQSVLHKPSGRETLAAPGNRIELFDDEPNDFDAWDIDPYTFGTARDAQPARSFAVVTETPLRVEIAFERPLGEASHLRQVVRLDAGSRRLELHTEIDWHESHTLLKACFPLAVRSRNATYEMPFGYAERPTHYSTSFDRARYEVPGHRFADLSEHGFGAALLSDSKYGFSCYGGDLKLTLLRSPKSPDPEADMGRHSFAYALLPHAGGWREAGVLREAALFDAPLVRTDGAGLERPFAVVEGELVLDTVKRAEDSDDVVLRLYEPYGGRGVARVRVACGAARRCTLLEEDGEEIAVEDGAVVIPYRPHEVISVKLSR